MTKFDNTFARLDVQTLAQVFSYCEDVEDKLELRHVHPQFRRAIQMSTSWDNISVVRLLQRHLLPDMHALYAIDQHVINPKNDSAHLRKLKWILERTTKVAALDVHIDSFWFRDGPESGLAALKVLESALARNAFRHLRMIAVRMELSVLLTAQLNRVLNRIFQNRLTGTHCALGQAIEVDVKLFSRITKHDLTLNENIKDLLATLTSPIAAVHSLAVTGRVWLQENIDAVKSLVHAKSTLKSISLIDVSSDTAVQLLCSVSSQNIEHLQLAITDHDFKQHPPALVSMERIFHDVLPVFFKKVRHFSLTQQPPREYTSSDWSRWLLLVLDRCPIVECIDDHMAKCQPQVSLHELIVVLRRAVHHVIHRPDNAAVEIAMFAPRGLRIEATAEELCIGFEDTLTENKDKEIRQQLRSVKYSFYDFEVHLKDNKRVQVLLDLCKSDDGRQVFEKVF